MLQHSETLVELDAGHQIVISKKQSSDTTHLEFVC